MSKISIFSQAANGKGKSSPLFPEDTPEEKVDPNAQPMTVDEFIDSIAEHGGALLKTNSTKNGKTVFIIGASNPKVIEMMEAFMEMVGSDIANITTKESHKIVSKTPGEVFVPSLKKKKDGE